MKIKELVKEMNKYSKNLSTENKAIFDKVLLKIRFSNIKEKEAEEFSYYCLDLFLQAEKDGKAVEEVLGTSDIDKFCDEYINQVRERYSFLQKLYMEIRYIPYLLFIFTGIWEMLLSYVLPNLISGNNISIDIPVTISMIINAIIAFVIVKYAMNHIGKASWELEHHDTKQTNRKYMVLVLVIYFGAVVLFVLSKLLFNQILFHVNFTYYMITLAILILLQNIYENRK